MVPASTEATPSSRPADGSPPADGVEDDEEENDLDVESLSLEAAQEMVEKIASQNQVRTTLRGTPDTAQSEGRL